MELLPASELKAILHSKRANIYYLEYCRVLQKDGRVLYLTETKKDNLYWNIPIANTTVILLGTGTSITQAAMRMLASCGVLVGFCGGGGTPLLMANEIEWLSPQSEYRPTEYVQGWMSFWFDEQKRLIAAKYFQQERMNFIRKVWTNDREFTRERDATDKANCFLNHGNYLAYGLAASCLWVLGIPHGFAVMHGKTRRGALVFDVADLIKDALILPLAFICASENATEQEFRTQCIQIFTKHKALDFMFETVKEVALKQDWTVDLS